MVFHEICFPDPDSNDFTKVRIDAGIYEAKNKQNIRYLLDILNNGIKNKNPLEKELYLAYANKLLEKEGVLIEEAYAHKTYFAHVDGGYEEVVNENAVSQIKTANGAPLKFILLGTDEDSKDDREIAITVATDEYEVLLPLGSIMNCKIKLKQ